MAKYCVFGGAGFIGQHVVNKLRVQGHEVIIVGNSRRNDAQHYDWSSLDYIDLKRILKGVEGVINLAYSSTPKTSFDDPIADIRDNLPFAINFFEWMGQFPISRIVMVSTGGAIYGNTNENPTSELAETNPISPYGITKLAVEKYAHMYFKHKGLPVISVRPGNAYGIGQTPFSGQGFIATATYSILENKAISIFGKEGTIRDYIHVEDVAEGIIAALYAGKPGEVYNIGTGIGTSNKTILDYLFKMALGDGFMLPEVYYKELRPFDVLENVLDTTKLTNHSGWRPKIDLSDGVQEYWNHAMAKVSNSSLNKVQWEC
ncbi:NAD-dependent epimerase/dehydratase family protein [Pontibacter sp. SGAir0037]|uniref:NAD-dependent epimerase/dehydratase family protein n=1 Tax=Pontibacter sp. SGAir0037 TaxID=2571030 RepID=UPI0010CCD375|nr:NAD-dependent epimerase/dehydratase family protein [Pontibacter sp. SGAir0037]QCR22603.1 epimerase [Pontibacter sp. SGAir0037]